jgi:hypothetical protein
MAYDESLNGLHSFLESIKAWSICMAFTVLYGGLSLASEIVLFIDKWIPVRIYFPNWLTGLCQFF